MRKALSVLLWTALIVSSHVLAGVEPISTTTHTYDEVTRAIRANDLVELTQFIKTPADANLVDHLQNSALHYAAMYGSAEAMDLLLRAGADVETKNAAGKTPLQLAAWELRRTKALVEHGAQVNPKGGMTPLMLACSARNNTATVRYLVEKGADVWALSPTRADALMACATTGETDAVALLLQKGADPRRVDAAGQTALFHAMSFSDEERIRLLLAAGADVNAKNTFSGMVKNGPIALTQLTPLMRLVPYGTPDAVRLLLKAGAKVNDFDIRKMTPLMLSIATDQADPAVVETLMKAGADVNAKDQNGETVLDWARKFQDPRIVSLVTAAGGRGRKIEAQAAADKGRPIPRVQEAIDRAVPLLNHVAPTFFREGGGCSGCHHGPSYARIPASASGVNGGFSIGRKAFLNEMMANRPRLTELAATLTGIGGDFDPPLAYLTAYADLGEPSNAMTDMLVHYLAARQAPSGAWLVLGFARPPLEDSTISRTAAAIRALKLYGWPARQAEFAERIARATKWLAQASPKTTYEAADQLMGLQVAGVPANELRGKAEHLLALQKSDGGWAQTPYLESDALATGMVLDTLYKTGFSQPNDPAYQRGTQFLLRTQYPDGSWWVRSRAPKFQPYFQSGFPFNHDQWISSDGTSWALTALAHAAEKSMTGQETARR